MSVLSDLVDRINTIANDVNAMKSGVADAAAKAAAANTAVEALHDQINTFLSNGGLTADAAATLNAAVDAAASATGEVSTAITDLGPQIDAIATDEP